MKKGIIATIALCLGAPVAGIVGIILLFVTLLAPAGQTGGGKACLSFDTAGSENSLVVQTSEGTLELGKEQLASAAEILAVGASLEVPQKGLLIALMTALQESHLWMYANESVPSSLEYPHDKVGSDHDSLNQFQQRSNWGSVKDRMNTTYAAKAFFGGPDGPNAGSPAGLLDTKGWQKMSPGEAAQAVQVSAKPDAYDKWEDAANTIISALGSKDQNCDGSTGNGTETVKYPLDVPYTMTSGYGPRDRPTAGASSWHPALDFVNKGTVCGKPVYSMMAGEVTLSSKLWISITSADGFVISYLHTSKSTRTISVGDKVDAGQRIAAVGSEGPSTGCHLDVRVNIAGNTNAAVSDANLTVSTEAPGGDWVNPEEFFAVFGLEICPNDWCDHA